MTTDLKKKESIVCSCVVKNYVIEMLSKYEHFQYNQKLFLINIFKKCRD